jgi:sulfur-oxidizing protein SoxY
MPNMPRIGRRRALTAAGALAAATALPLPAQAALRARTQAAIATIVGDRPLQEGRVALRLPAVAENGSVVPLTVTVESPMTAADHVKAVHVIAEANPRPEVASFHFTPACGRAEASTRIRLGETQAVIAVAEMSDGSVHLARQEVTVTIGGCGG